LTGKNSSSLDWKGRLFKGICLILILIAGSALQVLAQDKALSVASSETERLAILSRTPEGKVVLTGFDAKSQTLSGRDLIWPDGIRPGCPKLREDRSGRLYCVWEEPASDRGGIGFGSIAEGGSILPEKLILPEGSNSLPDLGFSPGNDVWLVWANDLDGRQALFARNMTAGRTWVISERGEFLRPRIICDVQDRIWIFWGETSPARFRILYRVFTGWDWTPARTACDAGPAAIQSFQITADETGSPWVAWSQYDFNRPGYGLYVSRKLEGDNDAWSEPVCLAATAGTQNIHPSIAWAAGMGPVVTWVRASSRESVAAVRIFSNGRWSGATALTGLEDREAVPQSAVAGSDLVVIWGSRSGFEWKTMSLRSLALAPAPPGDIPVSRDLPGRPWARAVPYPTIINNPNLDETAYIGFGDSITYGVIDSEWAPERGYIPRLEDTLNEEFGPSTVFNEGVGSEITHNGLARIDDVLAEDLARYILILEGTNDTVTDIYNLDVTIFNLQQMVVFARDFGAFPALSTLLPRFDIWAKPGRISAINARIRTLTETMIVPLVDFYNLFMDYPETDGGVDSLLSNDNLHPNEKGYQFMSDKWFAAIRNFPFPAESVQISREYDKIFFFEKPGNMIRWQDNAKVYDPNLIRGYRLYRKSSSAGDDALELLALVEDEHQYFDTAISSGARYTYVIATVMTDGLEGPCCPPVNF